MVDVGYCQRGIEPSFPYPRSSQGLGLSTQKIVEISCIAIAIEKLPCHCRWKKCDKSMNPWNNASSRWMLQAVDAGVYGALTSCINNYHALNFLLCSQFFLPFLLEIKRKWADVYKINTTSWTLKMNTSHHLDCGINFLLTGVAFSDQTSCRLAFTFVAKSLAMLLWLNYYTQLWLCKAQDSYLNTEHLGLSV